MKSFGSEAVSQLTGLLSKSYLGILRWQFPYFIALCVCESAAMPLEYNPFVIAGNLTRVSKHQVPNCAAATQIQINSKA